MSSSQSYTCITCRVAFATPDLQRAHYKSDWHRYNLKRKVAEMPAITAEDFKHRVLAQQAQTAEAQRDTTTMCKVCNKHFNTKNAYSNHLKSKKHRDIEAKLAMKQQSETEKRNAKNREKGLDADEDTEMDNKAIESSTAPSSSSGASSSSAPSSSSASGATRRSMSKSNVEPMEEEEEWEDVEGDDIPVTDCLFCSHSSANVEKNVKHMTKEHSFFLPNMEYLVDLDGLLTYLGEKVGSGFLCLWCNETGKAFFSLESVQSHMQDKGHCKLLCDGDAVYEYAEFYDFRTSYPDRETKQDSPADGATPDAATPMEEDDEEHIEAEAHKLLQDGYELVLPSGARIGHREMQVYYKQNIPFDRQIVKRPGMINRLLAQYKSLGWTGTTGDAAQKKIKDLRYIQKIRDKQYMRLGTKANKFQPHLRPQVVF